MMVVMVVMVVVMVSTIISAHALAAGPLQAAQCGVGGAGLAITADIQSADCVRVRVCVNLCVRACFFF